MFIRILLLAAVLAPGASALGVDGLQFQITPPAGGPAPGAVYRVSVYAHFPVNGTEIPWTTLGGTGQIGRMAGFNSAIFNIHGNTGAWSNLTLGPGLVGPPFGTVGTPDGSSVSNINTGVGFGPYLPGPSALLWSGDLTLPAVLPAALDLNTTFRPIGAPPFGPYMGMEVSLSGILLGLNVTHYLTNVASAHVVIPLPSPGAGAVLVFATAFTARRRRS